jgi:hypothetical protein
MNFLLESAVRGPFLAEAGTISPVAKARRRPASASIPFVARARRDGRDEEQPPATRLCVRLVVPRGFPCASLGVTASDVVRSA